MIRTKVSKLIPPKYKHLIRKLTGQNRYYDWSRLAAKIARKDVEDAKLRVGFVTSSGGHRSGNLLEPGLSLALNNDGISTSVLLCDGVLRACNITEYWNQCGHLERFLSGGPQATSTCDGCASRGIETWNTTNSEIFKYSEFVGRSNDDLFADEFLDDFKFRYRGFDIGEHVRSASLRFLCRGTFDFSADETLPVVRRYFNAAVQTVDVALGYIEAAEPDIVVCFHGIYVPHGVIGEVARSRGIRVVNWNTSYRQSRVLFSEGDTYHKTMCYEKERKWITELDSSELSDIETYLLGRETGVDDWQQFNDNPDMNILGDDMLSNFLSRFKKVFLLLPNVIWDAQLQYEPTIYPDMASWVIETIRLFKDKPKHGLVIRIHPAEIRRYSTTREPLMDIIIKAVKKIPANVHIIRADEEHSTYRLAENVDASIIFGTKTGLELAAVGHPVIVCGEAWIKDKGMSFDPKTIEEYESLLFHSDLQVTEEMQSRALRFAHHFFERAAIKVEFLKATHKNLTPTIDDSQVDIIASGGSPGLNSIVAELKDGHGKFIGGDVKQ